MCNIQQLSIFIMATRLYIFGNSLQNTLLGLLSMNWQDFILSQLRWLPFSIPTPTNKKVDFATVSELT